MGFIQDCITFMQEGGVFMYVILFVFLFALSLCLFFLGSLNSLLRRSDQTSKQLFVGGKGNAKAASLAPPASDMDRQLSINSHSSFSVDDHFDFDDLGARPCFFFLLLFPGVFWGVVVSFGGCC